MSIYLGKLPRRRNDGEKCAFPTQLLIDDVLIEGRCQSTRESKCLFCSRIHRENLRAVASSGFGSTEQDKLLWTDFFTMTAPGIDQFPWVHHRKIGEHICSGKNGCRPDEFAVAMWNEKAKQNWNWLMTALERRFRRKFQYFKSWELQERGLLHLHAICRHPGVSHSDFETALREIAEEWGFGEQIDAQEVTSATKSRTQAYLTKYVTKGSSRALGFDYETGELREARYRPWSASRNWGLSMREAKLLRIFRIREWLALTDAERAIAEGESTLSPVAQPLDFLYEKLRN